MNRTDNSGTPTAQMDEDWLPGYDLPEEERMATIALPADIEGPLAEEAPRLGITPERPALDTLRQRFTQPVPATLERPPEPNVAEFLTESVGLAQGSTEPISERCGERFAEGRQAIDKDADSTPSDDLERVVS
jgi:hypothetical protein